jgi:hypothetical protein
MKLLAILLVSVLFCYVYTNGCDKENACHVCQKTIYQLKFKYAVKCAYLQHCKTSCVKVLKEWSKPGSAFGAFQNDSVGKCDACFRAGFCSASTCETQKRREQQVIQKVVDGENLKGKGQPAVDGREMDKMVKKVLNNQKVNFGKVANKVRSQVKNALHPKKFEKNQGKLAKSLEHAVEFELV